MKKYLILITFFIFSTSILNAQWECPSKMAAHMSEIGASGFFWGSELTVTEGYLNNNEIFSTMLFLGFEYTNSQHSIYLEPGFKLWKLSEEKSGIDFDNRRLGFREFYYTNRSDIGIFQIGIQSSNLDDDYLLNERVFALTYKNTFDYLKFNFIVGSVSLDFSRNGTFCTNGFLYDLIPNRDKNLISNQLGESNLAAFTLSFLPEKYSEKDNTNIESSDDEFGEFDDFSDEFDSFDEDETSTVSIEDIGLAVYKEFGEYVPNDFQTLGLFTNINLWDIVELNPEILYQVSDTNNTLIYNLSLRKGIDWGKSHKTDFMARIVGHSKIDDNAKILNSYSNLLFSEVLRLDVPESPLFMFSFRHKIAKWDLRVKAQYSRMMNDPGMWEADILIGKKFFKHFMLNGIFSYLENDFIDDRTAVMGRLELRVSY